MTEHITADHIECDETGCVTRMVVDGVAYVSERTCHMKYVPEWSGDELYPTECYACETCGYISQDGKHRYCAECGAKVVDE